VRRPIATPVRAADTEDRYLELCPREWAKTRARLDDAELQAEVGTITVPPAPTAD